MSDDIPEIPEFSVYGEGIPAFDDLIQPTLDLRSWSDVPADERRIALQQILNSKWMRRDREILGAIANLNHEYLRVLPGRNLHETPPTDHHHGFSDTESRKAATKDFYRIFMEEEEPLVLRMLSEFARLLIDRHYYKFAKEATDPDERKRHVDAAFNNFDRFANCINHVFEAFAVNQLMTRNGFIPRQDETIEQELYKPTLQALSDPKWKPVNQILALMFDDFRAGRFSETITKAHSAVHSFLQIVVGEPGSNAKGEVGKLMNAAKAEGLIPTNRFTEPFVANIQSFIVSERATKSTAKPSPSPAFSADALFMMNLTMVFLQHCLQGQITKAT